MTFWNNSRYQNFERQATVGGLPTGQIPKQFPWHIDKVTLKDASGDLWEVLLQCVEVTPEKTGLKVTAIFRLEGSCQLSADKVTRLGFNPARLQALVDEGKLTTIAHQHEEALVTDYESLEKDGKALLKGFQARLRTLYSDNLKKETLTRRVRVQRFCRFSEE